ncbi:WYL domain-containing protein [Alteromonadaceae bacterium BrNp21-10]|nr:WYL domain-containing protein [Alteromonadaceae bacterium BrNp21-10]
MQLKDISFAQRQRLAYIDFCLLFRGHLCRNDLVQRFEVGLSAGTRDFNMYKELAADNLYYDANAKRYFQGNTFHPLFEHDPRKTLTKLANDISDGFDAIGDINFPVEAPSALNVPDIFVVARLVQAILNKQAVNVIYTSLTSGSNDRDMVPHSIIDNGLRWHVRAFDRKSESFRDFVLTRISKVTIKPEPVNTYEEPGEDHQWNRMMTLQLVPHPKNVIFPTAIEMDYHMENGKLALEVRAALVGYLLRRWNVDCTENASLQGGEYQLWLQNQQTLYGAENLTIAPGYTVDETSALDVG